MPRKHKASRIRKFFRWMLILAAAALLAVGIWFFREYRRLRPGLPTGTFFQVDKGQPVSSIAVSLEKRGLVGNRIVFRLAYRLFYGRQSLKAGEYAFPGPVTMKDILDALTKGKTYLHPVTIPEGLTGEEIGREFETQGLLPFQEFKDAFSDRELVVGWDPLAWNAEGYLFPETYHFSRATAGREIVERMTRQFQSVFSEAWRRRARDLGWSIRQVTILASLIEKETSRAEEKRLISAVFHNRLRIGMKLDCDPTIIYALKLVGDYEGRLRSHDLKLESPYNTYLHSGFPPGPICNPGRASLEAALYPADEEYLFFVSRNDGSHQFSRTMREHILAVRKYQK